MDTQKEVTVLEDEGLELLRQHIGHNHGPVPCQAESYEDFTARVAGEYYTSRELVKTIITPF